MKRFLWLLLVLACAVWLGLKIHQDPGYLLLAYQYWTIEMPLWLAGVLLIVAFILCHILLRLINSTSILGERFRAWAGRRKARRSRGLTQRGLIDLLEGRWQQAEKKLIRAVHSSEIPLINYLAAARGAQEQGEYDRRDDYLRMAHHCTPDAEIAVGVVQAELQLNHRQFEYAVATLQHIRELAPSHTYVLKLLKESYVHLRDFKNLAKLLPDLKRLKILSYSDMSALEEETYQALLRHAGKKGNRHHLIQFWETLPNHVHKNNRLIEIYARLLIEKSAHHEAERLLKEAIKREWDDQLIYCYGSLSEELSEKQLSMAESWLKHHSHNAILLLTLGKICIHRQLWGKARTYLENSLSITPTAEAYCELAKLLERTGDISTSHQYYRSGLLLAIQPPSL